MGRIGSALWYSGITQLVRLFSSIELAGEAREQAGFWPEAFKHPEIGFLL